MELIFWGFVILLCFAFMAKVIDDLFIETLDNISDILKLSPSVAGATIMAFGTSAPEISTTLVALFLIGANPATGLGTVVGSAIFQILVVVGFAAIVKTSYLDWKPVLRDGLFYTVTIFLLILIVQDNQVSLFEAAILVSTYFVYLVLLFFWGKLVKEKGSKSTLDVVDEEVEEASAAVLRDVKPGKRLKDPMKKILRLFAKLTYPITWLFNKLPDAGKHKKWTMPIFLGSLAAIGFLSFVLVNAAENFAAILGVPPAIIALTILAGGTSVPEMIASAIVSKQGRGDMAISNAIGSNVFDILMSLGFPLLIFTAMNGTLTDVGGSNITSSIWLLFATMLSVIVLLVTQRFKVSKKFGFVLIFFYVIYVIAAYSGII